MPSTAALRARRKLRDVGQPGGSRDLRASRYANALSMAQTPPGAQGGGPQESGSRAVTGVLPPLAIL